MLSLVLLLVASTGYVIVHHVTVSKLQFQASELARLQSEVSALQLTNTRPSQGQPDLGFYAQLGQLSHVEDEIKTLHAIARESGILIQQVNYKLNTDADIATYTIELPIRGTYLNIRQFCEAFLLAVPFASLDELSLRRDNSQSTQIDSKLKFTLYLNKSQLLASDVGGERS